MAVADDPLGGGSNPTLVKPQLSSDDIIARVGLSVAAVAVTIALILPLLFLMWRSVFDQSGNFVGLANFVEYLTNPTLYDAIWNSIWVSLVTALIVVPLAFGFAYALTRTCLPAKPVFRAIATLPILAPSLLPALALIYIGGNQGFLTGLIGQPLIGPVGIIISQVFNTFPHAMLILTVTLATADARLYEAAEVLRASPARIMWSLTLPNAKFGLVSAFTVVFTLVVTDFGVPIVIGGNFDVLATEVYKQVVGLQNFNMGAVVGMLLMVPAIVGFLLDRWARGHGGDAFSSRAVAYVPKPQFGRDTGALVLVLIVSAFLVGIVGVAVWGAFITFWPWDLTLTLRNFEFNRFHAAGWDALWVSLRMAAAVALFGTCFMFVVAYLLERGAPQWWLAAPLRFAIGLPLAVPGLVLSLSYVLFFNEPSNPFGFIFQTLTILVLVTLTSFYTVGHLAATAAVRQLDPAFEAVAASLKTPAYRMFFAVSAPMSLPAILDIAAYLFVNTMTAVSAVIFLFGPNTVPASVAVVHMNESGTVSAAAAMASMIVLIALMAKILQMVVGAVLGRWTQAWRKR
jgi:iron(III) transport system permease protein